MVINNPEIKNEANVNPIIIKKLSVRKFADCIKNMLCQIEIIANKQHNKMICPILTFKF